MYKYHLVIVLLMSVSCADEVPEEVLITAVCEKIDKTDKVINYRLVDCYNEMMLQFPEGVRRGTACNICGVFSAISSDTIVYYSSFYTSKIQSFSDSSYTLKWTLLDEGAKILGSDSSRTVKIVFNDLLTRVRIKIHSTDGNIACEDQLTVRDKNIPIEFGDSGQGGKVVLDKGQYSNGWRYMEAVRVYFEEVEWGNRGSLLGSKGFELGDGKINTETIFSHYKTTACETLDAAIAPIVALNNQSGGFTDWYLPSAKEALAIYEIFIAGQMQSSIWTSTEIDADSAYIIDYNTGEMKKESKNTTALVFAIRYF